MRNVEIKAKVRSLVDIVNKAKQLSNSDGQLIKQHDIFFNVPQGRLKLRNYEDKTADLIFYDRPDGDGPKLSEYEICKFPDGSQITSLLSRALGVKGNVVLSDDQTVEQGQVIAEKLMTDLGVENSDLIKGAYMDLLLK
ncbi:hypothetical protein C0J52_11046 [Blattella germanica]|nr:hypothetical protein C0J52_11046 [Blattella germanica]